MTAKMTFRAERLESVEALLDEIDALGEQGCATPFQTRLWLENWYRFIAPSRAATPLPVAVRCGETNQTAALLPLIMRTDGRLRVIEFADLGVTDYNGPVLGPSAPSEPADNRAFLIALRKVLPSADLIRFEKQPVRIRGRDNPLAVVPGAQPSGLYGNVVMVEDSAEAFVRARGRKYRKEVERCFRVLESRGQRAFAAASVPEEAIELYRVLEGQQSQRMTSLGKTYLLDEPAYSRFYESVLLAGLERRAAEIFCLSVDGNPVALIYGIADRGKFLLLRISNAGEAWKACSPGRLVVVETIRQLRGEGIRIFDMTIGDYAFKRGFSPVHYPLADLHLPLSTRGMIIVARERAKGFVRARPQLAAFANRVLGRNRQKPDRGGVDDDKPMTA